VKDHIIILIAEDDPDDLLLMLEAFRETGFLGEIHAVKDGQEALDYLHKRGKFEAKQTAPRPDLILLDLNLPGLDGHEVLGQIKSDSTLQLIPVVVLTTSQDRQDVVRSYSAGASSYITKPQDFHDLVNIIGLLEKY
jgi:CheY-like chemotaxis protein